MLYNKQYSFFLPMISHRSHDIHIKGILHYCYYIFILGQQSVILRIFSRLCVLGSLLCSVDIEPRWAARMVCNQPSVVSLKSHRGPLLENIYLSKYQLIRGYISLWLIIRNLTVYLLLALLLTWHAHNLKNVFLLGSLCYIYLGS